MSNAASIFLAARTRLQDILGPNYREHTNIFETDELASRVLENGYSVILLDSQEKNPQVNSIFLQRRVRVTVTHRTYASVDAGKVVAKLSDVYDKESAIIASLRDWSDASIGLIKFLPTSETTIEPHETEEDSFLVNKINFDILYQN